ncbi:hydrogenase maturation nickel metallochaperone HypA [Legionella oakridgensis]|uniref:Hydrogenase maturation factor HypA n=2 Tax=Legionella oakridgensis TaxID=29423 RepID=W0BHB3_9GAMM|nr:hydrogenase maturation nickel metallochaperone HypA [Legionella oakridgensis]AHE68027.1 hydrogenase nickel insertion protein HypA [Legionella oakridgensis ATCC 33761 = DSM 21215]ETO92455.1 hydrogenase-3 nickel incorporation protein HypA [Legionella oakridgensis RV-2-2007]KTD44573.1 hydrogenase nickel incorporation protein HypA [Legionella oakridgensis]STY21016.1 hydrogenase nickel incorporation protein HypA [Legionella longbeachae]
MHELSLCKNILEIIKQHVSGREGGRVKKICLEIGALTAVDHAALRFGFEVVSQGSMAEQAVLDIIEVQGMAICDSCQQRITIQNYYDSCTRCGHWQLTVMAGEELRVKYMEME